MKTILLPILFATLPYFFAVPVAARPLEETRAAVAAPILLENVSSSRMHVVYRHDKHPRLPCLTCHHKMSPEREVFVSCGSSAACHSNTDIANRSVKSYYQALHRPDSPRSCRGCHTKESAAHPRLDGCQTCHSALTIPSSLPDDAETNQ